MSARWRPALALAGVLAGESLSAAAHVVTTGFGPVADGIGHFAASPEDLIPAIALAVFAGLRGKAHARCVSRVLPLTWVAGGVAGLAFGAPLTVSLAWLPLVAMGGLVALDLRMPLAATAALALLLGAFVGYANGAFPHVRRLELAFGQHDDHVHVALLGLAVDVLRDGELERGQARPNQRARRLAPKCSFSERSASVGSW